ncbi:MAG: DUF3791 domain-containing protein [Tannerellaceae bacterium]|jgi:hypothetical protein|nr:DUF3791 domain-containing protein [Tannerellaceae bacterium]
MEALKEKRILDRETQNKVNFMTFIIAKFARAYKMSKPDAYLYLKKYGGMDFLNEHWWTLHVEDPYWSLRELYEVCYENGGLK